jgi:EAL domain-containing protein (putative c-di-GMP-specific phosphodiesterase class I)
MREALDEQARWTHDPVTAHLTVAINISAAQLYQPDFTGEVLESITRSGADPHRVVLELTESILLDDMLGAIAILEKLREHGIRFSIDDFGTGYSSLGYLQSLPINELKIDRSFVRELPESTNSLAIVKTIVALASALDMKVIAEGVESEDQRAVLPKTDAAISRAICSHGRCRPTNSARWSIAGTLHRANDPRLSAWSGGRSVRRHRPCGKSIPTRPGRRTLS